MPPQSRLAYLAPAIVTGWSCTLALLGYRIATHRLGANPIATAINQLGLLALVLLVASLSATPLKLTLGWTWPLHLFESRYGVALSVKLVALVVVAALGAYNWRVVQPSVARPEGEGRLVRSARLELLFGLLILAATAVLVALPFPGDEM